MLEDRQLILRARLLCFWEEIKSLRTEIIFFSVVNYTNRPRLDSRDHELNYPCSIIIGFLHVRGFFHTWRAWGTFVAIVDPLVEFSLVIHCFAKLHSLDAYSFCRSWPVTWLITSLGEAHHFLGASFGILVTCATNFMCCFKAKHRFWWFPGPVQAHHVLGILSRGCVLARKAALNHGSQDQGLSGDCLRGNRQPLEVPRSDNNSCNSCKSCKRLQTFHG